MLSEPGLGLCTPLLGCSCGASGRWRPSSPSVVEAGPQRVRERTLGCCMCRGQASLRCVSSPLDRRPPATMAMEHMSPSELDGPGSIGRARAPAGAGQTWPWCSSVFPPHEQGVCRSGVQAGAVLAASCGSRPSCKLAIAAREVAGLSFCSSRQRVARAFNFQGKGAGRSPSVHLLPPRLSSCPLPDPHPLQLPLPASPRRNRRCQGIPPPPTHNLLSAKNEIHWVSLPRSGAASLFLRFCQKTSFRFQDSVVIVT